MAADRSSNKQRPPATTPEAREKQLVALAFDVAEEQMRNGTASAQVITHYLKLGTKRAELEDRKLERETSLLEAREQALASEQRIEALMSEAMEAMRSYRGGAEVDRGEY